MANVSSSNGLEKYPKLRFPGFEEPWTETAFSSFSAINPKSENLPDKFIYIDLESVLSGELQSEKIEFAQTAPSRAQRTLIKNDVLFQTVRPYQQNNYFYTNTNINNLPCVASTGYAVFRTKNNAKFLYALIHTNSFLADILKRCTGSNYPSINGYDIENITIFYPSLQEQEKIGDFMSLIDKKIRKTKLLIKALKKYKRGVINSIFSQNVKLGSCKTTWTIKTLSDLCCEFKSGRNISPTLIHDTGFFPVYGGNGIRGYCDNFSHNGEYVIVGRQGALCGNVRLIQGQNYLSEHAIAVRANEENETKFLLYLFSYMRLGQYSDQGAQPGLSVNKLLRLKCAVPNKKVQAKIAEWLLKIDSYITTHEKIETCLLEQRKALLQRLFI